MKQGTKLPSAQVPKALAPATSNPATPHKTPVAESEVDPAAALRRAEALAPAGSTFPHFLRGLGHATGYRAVDRLRSPVAAPRAPGVVQRAYDEPQPNTLAALVKQLALMTTAGSAGWAAGRGEIQLISGNAWTSRTRDGLGIVIAHADHARLTEAATQADKPLTAEERTGFALHVAHELTHVRHFLESREDFQARGDRGAFGSGWDADPEEELTIRGICIISVERWRVMYERSLKAIESSNKAIEEFEEVSKSGAKAVDRARAGRQMREEIAKRDALRMNPVPAGAVRHKSWYILLDPNSENAARAELRVAPRVRYTDVNLEPARGEVDVEAMQMKQVWMIETQLKLVEDIKELEQTPDVRRLLDDAVKLFEDMLALYGSIQQVASDANITDRLLT